MGLVLPCGRGLDDFVEEVLPACFAFPQESTKELVAAAPGDEKAVAFGLASFRGSISER